MPQAFPHILESLKDLPPNHIYALAPKEYILRGYDYYAQERLETYQWNTGKTLLTAFVRGSKRYAVQLSTHHQGLRYSCNCPAWNVSTQCKHVICMLLTTINVLVPGTFSLPGNHTARRNTLSRSLLPHSSSSVVQPSPKPFPSQLEVVLSDHPDFPAITVKKDGKSCKSFYGIPTELTLLMRGAFDPAWLAHDNLLTYLNQYGNTHQLAFETPEGRTPLTWRPSQEYQSTTELDVRGDHIDIHKRCLLRGVVQRRARSFQHLVANLETQELSPLKDTAGWELFFMAHEMIDHKTWAMKTERSFSQVGPTTFSGYDFVGGDFLASSLKLTLDDFHRLQLNFSNKDEALRHVLLKIEGQDAPLHDHSATEESLPPTYRLNILPYDEETAPFQTNLREPLAVLQTESRLGSVNFQTHAQTFQFFPAIEQTRDLSQAFRSQKRKALLRETFFRLLGSQTPHKANSIIKEAMTAKEFQAYGVKSEARHLLKKFHDTFWIKDFRLIYGNNQWRLFPNDKAREALLYAIPFDIFGHQIFRNMTNHDQMSIPLSVLNAQLPELHAKLQAVGLELFYHQKPILTSTWEFSFDAQRPPDIDWFEIRPEIKCDGVRLSETAWMEALQKGSVTESEEGIRILDMNTMEVLKSLSSIYPTIRTGKDHQKKIVHVPTLQILDWIVLRKHGVKIILSEEDEALFQRLLHFEKIDSLPLPKKIKAKLRTYQHSGYQWLSFLYQHRFGACLADDMGLGKTIQAISLLAGIQEGLVTSSKAVTGPHLIVLPPSLLFNWEHEITRFYPDLKIQWYNSKDRSPTFTDCDIVLTTYGVVRRDIDTLEKIPFHVIIFDEAQAVKNIKAHSTGAARRLRGHFKLAMTGTPLENHLGEYYSLIDLCLPGLLGDYDDFRSHMKSGEPAKLEKLLQRTKPFVLRRTKSEILKELPPKIETDMYLDLTERQKSLYQQTVASIRPTIEDAYRTKTASQARVIALTAILKLRQVCLSPKLLNPDSSETSPKITCLLDRLAELLDEGHSALVFSQFTSFLDIVEHEFSNHGIPYTRLDGSTPTKTRKKLVQDFQEGDHPAVFLLSLKAGGQGLNLTKASYVFHLDPWWNPAVENQASDRAHRIGQQQKVSIMRLLMHHTIEEKMMDLKKHKLALYEAVMAGSTQGGTGTGITKADFDFLLE